MIFAHLLHCRRLEEFRILAMRRKHINARVCLWKIGIVVIGHACLRTSSTTKESQDLLLLRAMGRCDIGQDCPCRLACIAQLCCQIHVRLQLAIDHGTFEI